MSEEDPNSDTENIYSLSHWAKSEKDPSAPSNTLPCLGDGSCGPIIQDNFPGTAPIEPIDAPALRNVTKAHGSDAR